MPPSTATLPVRALLPRDDRRPVCVYYSDTLEQAFAKMAAYDVLACPVGFLGGRVSMALGFGVLSKCFRLLFRNQANFSPLSDAWCFGLGIRAQSRTVRTCTH